MDTARQNFHNGSNAVEVIVSDNCSTDKTAEIAESRGCTVVKEDKRVIAAVRNAGAAVATGEIICFLDADSQIHPNTFNAVEQAISSGKVVGGATGVTLDRMTLGIAMTYYLVMLPMILVTGMDTGVVFCSGCNEAPYLPARQPTWLNEGLKKTRRVIRHVVSKAALTGP